MKDKSYTVYLADIRPLLEEDLQQKVYERLPKIRQQKANACKLPGAKAASIAAGFLMEYALKQQGLSGYRIVYAKSGAPVAIQERSMCFSEEERSKVYISISHSGDHAACVISSKPVGIDIQQIRPVRAGTLQHFFEPAGRKCFLEEFEVSDGSVYLNDCARNAFLWQWAAKESYMKLTGEGMSMGFDQLLVEADGENVNIRDLQNRYAPARIYEHHVLDDYCLTVCVGEK